MGLAERRVTEEFKTNELPKLQSEVDQAAGFQVPIEVHWDNLSPEGESRLYRESWRSVYFEPLIAALKSIGRDDMGKQALKEGLQRIVIQNSDGNSNSDRWATFQGKTLTLDHLPTTNAQDTQARANTLVGVLERGL